MYPETIQIRAEAGLRAALASAARDEFTSSSDFIRRALRAAVSRHVYRQATRDGYKLRRAVQEDLDRFEGGEHLTSSMPWVGTAITLNEEVVAALIIVWDAKGRAWLIGPRVQLVPLGVIEVAVSRLAEDLRLCGEPALHTFADEQIENHSRALTFMGFEPSHDAITGREVWVLRLGDAVEPATDAA